jgi:hypothetical protein
VPLHWCVYTATDYIDIMQKIDDEMGKLIKLLD